MSPNAVTLMADIAETLIADNSKPGSGLLPIGETIGEAIDLCSLSMDLYFL